MIKDIKKLKSDMFTGRMLVVEDEEINRLVVGGIMNQLGIDPDFAENGLEAIDKAAAQFYDLILMDVQMPEMNGIEATALIRQGERTSGRKRATIVALTANVSAGDRERCLEAGMDDFMAKPLMRDTLIDTLERWLGGHGLRGEQPVPGTDNSGGPLDGTRFAALERSMSSVPGGLRGVLESYQESLTRLLGTLRTALETGDAEAMARAAHALKSNSAAAGALELAALCADIEQQAREDGTEGAGSRIVEIESEISRVGLAIKAELSRISK